MRKITAGLFVSLDGVTESPDQWQLPYFNEEMAQTIQQAMAESDTMLLGRRTYEEFAAYWAHQPSDAPFAEHMNTTPKLVVSTTLKTVEWQNSSLLGGDVFAQVRKLKEQPGRNIAMTGSVTLVRSLLREGLLDRLDLLVCPIVLGKGGRLFEDIGEQIPLKLVESRTFATGVLSLSYERDRKA
jgi:dihydrofolate reductase